jgi:hypothetical protein
MEKGTGCGRESCPQSNVHKLGRPRCPFKSRAASALPKIFALFLRTGRAIAADLGQNAAGIVGGGPKCQTLHCRWLGEVTPKNNSSESVFQGQPEGIGLVALFQAARLRRHHGGNRETDLPVRGHIETHEAGV